MTSRLDRSVGRQVVARLDILSTLPCGEGFGDKQRGKLSGKTTTPFDQIDDAKSQAYELNLIECFGFSASSWYSTSRVPEIPAHRKIEKLMIISQLRALAKGSYEIIKRSY